MLHFSTGVHSRGVNNVVFSALGSATRTKRNFFGSGIRFLGGSMGSTLTGIVSRQNGIGLSMAPGDYRGKAFGTLVQGNTIRNHLGDGLRLIDARGVTIGGAASGLGNTISVNHGAGMSIAGACVGSTAEGNTVVSNLRGNGEPRSLRGRP